MEKRRKQSGSGKVNKVVDGINGLPIHLLHHIFSFLPTHDVVRTCVLSKQWRNIWCSVPTLDFHEDRLDFVKFVDSVLFLRDGSNIQTLRFFVNCMKYDMCRINTWILCAIRRNVEVLQIEITRTKLFELTSHVFKCESLTELKLFHSIISLPTSICLPALKALNLHLVMFKDDQVEQVLFSALPSLETLSICMCGFRRNKLFISVPQLKNLKLTGVFPSSVEIYAPYLMFLKLHIINAVTIGFNGSGVSIVNAHLELKPAGPQSMIHLLAVLKNVDSMTLYDRFLQSFIIKMQKDLSILECITTRFYNMKWLKIRTSFSDEYILVINTLLQHSPNIETILLENEVGGSYCYNITGKRFEAEKVWSHYKLSHLKLVEIQSFRGSENEVKLVKFFLENAMVLEKLIIMKTSTSEEDNDEMKKIGRKLLSYPRASPSLGILFA